ncbi:MAG TPA: hypothetical protein VMQ11_02410 [Alphaproteobacteria bacterium]|nr:hypothetical protein [Alphaproteobacteria bacterium]HUK70836.1 hypothetical protein [Streptosporangiaceae bacterium]
MAAGDRQASRWHLSPALLGIYLNDHLAGATAGVQLAQRAAASNRNTRIGEPLEHLAAEMAEEKAAMIEMMRALGVPVRHYKVYAAWLGEKAGRVKLNGHLVRRSPLSALEEIEALQIGVAGKTAAWRTLRALAEHDSRLDRWRLDHLIAAADRQSHVLEEIRLRAVAEVLASS